ncbi:MAG: response regulator transcription factor [Anaerolineales bacterium]|nr:response regulator transcription factor [Anaerolineales bacterium]
MKSSEPIRVLIVDDHTVVRKGLGYVLRTFEQIEPVGEADSVESAVQACETLGPDVVLMDLKLQAENDGITAIRQIREIFPHIQLIALTSFYDRDLVSAALAAGACGYLLKDISTDELARAIQLARAGTMTLAPEATRALLQRTPETVTPAQVDLTPRQMEVLQLLAQGKTNQEIAQHLQVTLYTARHHVSEILARLEAANRAEAVAIALRHGLVKA